MSLMHISVKGDCPAFSLKDLVKGYISREGTRIPALNGVSFEALRGRITCIVGPTGSGKSTILRIVSGIETTGSGEVVVSGQDPSDIRGQIGYLTQRHTLFPWMRIKDNIGLPLEIKGVAPGTRDGKVLRICEILGIQQAVDLYPNELSGGMQQRAALGRLLAAESSYWLLDEPFSALDDRTSHQLQSLLLRLAGEHNISVLFVTHSIDEAVFLADRVVVLSAGPGRVVDIMDLDLARPRNRLSSDYGRVIEKIRCRIESVLEEENRR
jgi:NitT/TauT family transport system ATP-binding protein